MHCGTAMAATGVCQCSLRRIARCEHTLYKSDGRRKCTQCALCKVVQKYEPIKTHGVPKLALRWLADSMESSNSCSMRRQVASEHPPFESIRMYTSQQI